MSSEVKAIVRWLPESRGGRRAPPPPTPTMGYSSPARFESDPTASKGVWSVRLFDAIELHGPEVIDVRIEFLMPEAPHELLREGERFELMEGRKVVAKGVVVPSAMLVPRQINAFELALLG